MCLVFIGVLFTVVSLVIKILSILCASLVFAVVSLLLLILCRHNGYLWYCNSYFFIGVVITLWYYILTTVMKVFLLTWGVY